MLRITNISYSTKIFKNKIKANKTKNAIMALPIVSTPLIAYYSVKENKNIRNNSIQEEKTKCKELHSSNHPITDNTKYNTRALENAGYNKSEIEQHLDKNGNIADNTTKQDLRNKNIPFKGDPDDLDAHEATLDSDLTGDAPQIYDENKVLSGLSAESREMLDEINNTDMSLPPDLQDIIDMPSIDTPEGFIDTIFGDLPEGMSVDEDIWSMLKGIANEILDIGDWF